MNRNKRNLENKKRTMKLFSDIGKIFRNKRNMGRKKRDMRNHLET